MSRVLLWRYKYPSKIGSRWKSRNKRHISRQTLTHMTLVLWPHRDFSVPQPRWTLDNPRGWAPQCAGRQSQAWNELYPSESQTGTAMRGMRWFSSPQCHLLSIIPQLENSQGMCALEVYMWFRRRKEHPGPELHLLECRRTQSKNNCYWRKPQKKGTQGGIYSSDFSLICTQMHFISIYWLA